MLTDWNVVVTVAEGGYRKVLGALAALGTVTPTEFYNVLVMRVADSAQLLEALAEQWRRDPDLARALGRVIPVERTFVFQSPEEFEAKAGEEALAYAPRLAGRSFHVRMHRRGFKGRLRSQHEEQFLDHALLEHLAAAGTPGRMDFADPDFILAVETVGQRAGLSLWARAQRERYPFLGLD